MNPFTENELILCREIAKRWRKPIEAGDWALDWGRAVLIATMDSFRNEAFIYLNDGMTRKSTDLLIPLLALSDCLDKLGEMGLEFRLENIDGLCKIHLWYPEIKVDGATLREAALRALLEALRRETK